MTEYSNLSAAEHAAFAQLLRAWNDSHDLRERSAPFVDRLEADRRIEAARAKFGAARRFALAA